MANEQKQLAPSMMGAMFSSIEKETPSYFAHFLDLAAPAFQRDRTPLCAVCNAVLVIKPKFAPECTACGLSYLLSTNKNVCVVCTAPLVVDEHLKPRCESCRLIYSVSHKELVFVSGPNDRKPIFAPGAFECLLLVARISRRICPQMARIVNEPNDIMELPPIERAMRVIRAIRETWFHEKGDFEGCYPHRFENPAPRVRQRVAADYSRPQAFETHREMDLPLRGKVKYEKYKEGDRLFYGVRIDSSQLPYMEFWLKATIPLDHDYNRQPIWKGSFEGRTGSLSRVSSHNMKENYSDFEERLVVSYDSRTRLLRFRDKANPPFWVDTTKPIPPDHRLTYHDYDAEAEEEAAENGASSPDDTEEVSVVLPPHIQAEIDSGAADDDNASNPRKCARLEEDEKKEEPEPPRADVDAFYEGMFGVPETLKLTGYVRVAHSNGVVVSCPYCAEAYWPREFNQEKGTTAGMTCFTCGYPFRAPLVSSPVRRLP